MPAPSFQTRQALLRWEGGEIEVEPQPPTRATGRRGVAGPLRLWRDESDTDTMTGAIALVMLAHARHSTLRAAPIAAAMARVADAGAVGLVFVTNGPTGETILLNAPLAQPARLPIAVLGPKPGAAAIAVARDGRAGVLIIDGAARTVRSPNIWGSIDRSGPYVVISTPRTAWTAALAERGPGFAAFNALAAWAPAALPNHSLLFVSTTAHEYENAGSHAFLDHHAPAPDRVALWLHLGAGFAARDFHEIGAYRLAPLPSPDPQRFLIATGSLVPMLRECFAGQPGLESAYPANMGAAGELAEVLQRGYAPAIGLFGAHRFHHIAGDRIDKTDPAWIDAVIRSLKTALTRALAG